MDPGAGSYTGLYRCRLIYWFISVKVYILVYIGGLYTGLYRCRLIYWFMYWFISVQVYILVYIGAGLYTRLSTRGWLG